MRAPLTRHISTQNEAQSMVGGNFIVLQHFIVINQHMGLDRNAEFTIQALKTPKMNFTGISLQSVATQYFDKNICCSRDRAKDLNAYCLFAL